MSDNSSTQEYSPKIIGHNIRQARERIGMKQKDLAAMMGISDKTLIATESGQRDPALGEIHQFAKHLKTTANELLHLGSGSVVHNFHSNQQEGQVNILNSGHMSSERELFERLIADLEARIKDLQVEKSTHRDEIAFLRTKVAELEAKTSRSTSHA